MKKMIAAFLLAAVLVFAAASSVFAAGSGLDMAKAAALDAAGRNAEDVVFTRTAAGFDDGRDVFEVRFMVPGEAKYVFEIDAETGTVLEKSMELWNMEDDLRYSGLPGYTGFASAPEISAQEAKSIALRDAGFIEPQVRFTACHEDREVGRVVFEIEFIGPNGMEYSYVISASDGRILDRDCGLFA